MKKHKKKGAYDLSDDVANKMVTRNRNFIECKSFTSTALYSLSLKQTGPGELTIISCICPDFISMHIICKYMFLANRISQIPPQTHGIKYNPSAPVPPQQQIDSNNNNLCLQQNLS